MGPSGNLVPGRKLIITIDVEAQPARAERDHIDRLIWGRFGDAQSGMAELMTCAERRGLRLTTFFDYAEQYLYGDSMLDVAREIHRRGHDLQLHLHPEFLSDDFFRKHSIGRVHNLNTASPEGAAVCARFLAAAQREVTGEAPLSFRGGGYRFSANVLRALAQEGVRVDSSYNPSRATQPVHVGYSKQFPWHLGMFELPVSNVFAFSNPDHHLDYNFNASSLWGKSPIDCALRHRRYLDAFYSAYGEDAIAVLVLHSWSLLQRDDRGHYQYAGAGALERFDALLTSLSGHVRVIDSRAALDLMQAGAVAAQQDLDLAEAARLAAEASTRGAALAPVTAPKAAPVASSPAQSIVAPPGSASAVCAICGTLVSDFEDFNGPKRRCSGCGSVERQRAFAALLKTRLSGAHSLVGKRVLLIAPSSSERRLLKEAGIEQVLTADIRPEVKPDLVVDVCNMANVASESFDVVVASYVLTCVHSLDSALTELSRILRPGGLLLSSDPLAKGRATQEHHDESVVTSWYGKEAFEKYRVGSFRTLGELDAAQRLGQYFACEAVATSDVANGSEVVWFVSRKREAQARSGGAAESAPLPRSVAEPVRRLQVTACNVCGESLAHLTRGEQNCPNCGSRARLRALVPTLAEVLPRLGPSGLAAGKPLLGFAMTSAEIKQLDKNFPLRKSASLFGNYASDHELGVDVRDLSRYSDSSFCGVFASLLFDYFKEHDAALAECYRVTAPGGVLLTHIAPYRLLGGSEPPQQSGAIVGKAGSFDYLPEGQALPDVKVGREWFLTAMRRAGFETTLVVVKDAAPDMICEWFIGVKSATAREAQHQSQPVPSPASRVPAPNSVRVGVSTTQSDRRWLAATRELFKAIVPFGAGGTSTLTFDELVLLDGPPLSLTEDSHAGGRREIVTTDRGRRQVYTSSDNGATFRRRYDAFEFPRMVRQTFTLANGQRIVKLDESPLTYLFDAEDRLLSTGETGRWNWAGAQGIGQASSGTVMFAEYAAFKKGISMEPLSVWRLRPRSTQWEKVLTLETAYEPPEGEIRHFHLCTPNPAKPAQWLLASGDKGRHNRLWTSDDDGDSWQEIGYAPPAVDGVQAHRLPGAFRLTQINSSDDGELVWGSDDTLGVGRAILMGLSLAEGVARFRHLGWAGPNAVRNVVKLGSDLFLFLGEAKGAGLESADCVLLDIKTGRRLALTLPNIGNFDSTTTDSLGTTHLRDNLGFFPCLGSVLTTSKAGILRLRLEDAASTPLSTVAAGGVATGSAAQQSGPALGGAQATPRAALSRPRFRCNPRQQYGLAEATRICFWDNARGAFALQQEVGPGETLDVPLADISESFDFKVKVQTRIGSNWIDRIEYKRVEIDAESLHGIRYRYFPRAGTKHLLVVFQAMNTTPGYNYLGTLKNVAASRLYIKDDYGEDEKTRSSYYLGARRSFDVSEGVRSLIREALVDLGLRPQHITMGGSSKGAFAALFHGYALNVGHIIAGGPQVLLGNFLNSRSPASVLPPILRYLAGDLSPDSVAWANNVLFEQLAASAAPYPNVVLHVGEHEPHHQEHVRPLLDWLAAHGFPAPQLDLGNYTTHAELDRHFPSFFQEQCEKIAGKL